MVSVQFAFMHPEPSTWEAGSQTLSVCGVNPDVLRYHADTEDKLACLFPRYLVPRATLVLSWAGRLP